MKKIVECLFNCFFGAFKIQKKIIFEVGRGLIDGNPRAIYEYQYSPLKKTILFYPYDFDKYKELRGGFYLNYEKELLGHIFKSEAELIEALKHIDEIELKYKRNIQKFNQEYNYLSDGKACKRFVEKLI